MTAAAFPDEGLEGKERVFVYAESDYIKYYAIRPNSITNLSQQVSDFGEHGGSRMGVDIAAFVGDGYELVWDEDPYGNKKPLPESVKRSIEVDLGEVMAGGSK